MISRIKRWFNKKKILIERLREENNLLKDQLITKRKEAKIMSKTIVDTCDNINLLQDKIVSLQEKKKKAEIHIAELVGRKNEVLRRLKSKIPDEVIGGRFENYKYWIGQPFIVENYFAHLKVDDTATFIDSFAAYRGLAKVLEDEKKDIKDS